MAEARTGAKRFRIERLEDRIAPGILSLGGVFDASSHVLSPESVAVAGQVHAPVSASSAGQAEQVSRFRARLALLQTEITVVANAAASRVEELLEQVDRHLSDVTEGVATQVPPHLLEEIDRELEQKGSEGVSLSRVVELLAEVDNHLMDQDTATPSASGIIRLLGEIEQQVNSTEPERVRTGSPAR